MSLVQLFRTDVYKTALKFPNPKRFKEELIKECYQLREMDTDGKAWSAEKYLGGYTSYSSYADLHKWSSGFAEIESKINPHVKKYLRQLGYETKGFKLEMTNIWVNIMGPGTVHTMHIHPHSVVSGTLYVKVPKDGVGLKFEDPRMGSLMAALPKKANISQLRKNFVEIKPDDGDLLLFESWMRHEVPPNPSKEDRISVSFNYSWF